ncbi:hypothetical protein FSP39_013702 [Pinctada imbricata]|uniref:Uncharacterized protein n=1 Tax=Pinctada imbricata TaxID=66713 RepID=A0AA88Y992_PINIB|nr:hypothetical protein FSP39_013702 [Pinctada imbricata]
MSISFLVDGGWSSWGSWGSCSKTCGSGVKSRSRSCTNPIPVNGGDKCTSGSSTSTTSCNTQGCAVDGGYTDWSSWITCSVTCGGGYQTRTRSCTSPAPQHGGADCVGDGYEKQGCNAHSCPIDGALSKWSSWGKCTVTCGGGSQIRERSCTNPTPQYGGADCSGDRAEKQTCNDHHCPIDGAFTDWSSWGKCTVTCGGGSQIRGRSCTNPAPQHGGADCTGDTAERQKCNNHNCPIDGAYSDWTTWDTCSVTCGGGTQNRERSCTNPVPQHGGADCTGDSSQVQSCNKHSCPIDGAYSDWTSWDTCSVTCGGGSQNRERTCTNPAPQHGGADCTGDSSQVQSCNKHACPIDGAFTDWSVWGTCSVTCGGGRQARDRSCTNPAPQYGGADCSGDRSESQNCNKQNCPIDGAFTDWSVWGTCTLTCGGGRQTRDRSCTSPSPQYGGSDCTGDRIESQDCNTHFCPIDGAFTNWSAWGTCSLTCGGGRQIRDRSCTSPSPQYGGADCTGDRTESQDCNTHYCPIDGAFTDWSVWGTCSLTCGGGRQTRDRYCTNPAPQYGGADCTGDTSDAQDCNTHNCPIDGAFTDWSVWGTCSLTCGGGRQTRDRSCTNPAPQYGGVDCTGDTSDVQDCNTHNCPIDGAFTDWTSWDTCTVTCGGGTQNRERSCTNPAPQYGGADCTGDTSEIQDCNTQFCPIDGAFTDWTSWDTCTVTCGGGTQNRERSCTNPAPQYGGADCTGDTSEIQDCNTHFCPIDGAFTDWTSWDTCTVTCGGGTHNRDRSCTNPAPQYGGADCTGDTSEIQDCNTHFCPIDGAHTDWTSWDTCTVTCGGGTQNRERSCTNPAPQYGGADCTGDTSEIQDCNTHFCPIDGAFTDWTSWDTCTVTCGGGTQNRERSCTNPAPQYGGADCTGDTSEIQDCNTHFCPIDGAFTDWTSWDTCTVTCGGGTQNRERSCTNPAPQYGGADCTGDPSEIQDCNTHFCPIDGAFTDWTSWDTCTVTCGGGTQNRERSCTNPAPQYGGADCTGDTSEIQDCNTHFCPIDGAFNDWAVWGTCTVTCGGGSQTRDRSCTNPAPQYGGADCAGDRTESQDCNTHNCPIDGALTAWTSWDTCTVTCGGGTQNRGRTCTNPAPQYGGADCTGDRNQTQDCNTHNCPIDGAFTDWSAWGTCTVTCGGGSHTRDRTCTNPAPQYGGADCTGDTSEKQSCNDHHCPIDGAFTDWSVWNTCTVTCGGGSQARDRSCTNPAPQHGGADCTGDTSESQDCNTHNCPIDGAFSDWSAWGTCTVTCGGGSQTRDRSCSDPAPQYGGADCVGATSEVQDCNDQYCPIDGGLSDWSAWGFCTVTCGGGTQNRERTCTNPVPQHGGADCNESLSDVQDCNTDHCPIDGVFTDWSAWDSCTTTCGGGTQNRERSCTNPAPQYGGADCVGDRNQTQDCNSHNCPIDGGFSAWTSWDTCTETCGGGIQNRERSCTNPVPQYGGSDCYGNDTETQDCNTHHCPIHGNWTQWDDWVPCSVTCGGGTQGRNRSCTSPAPQHGGDDCVGQSSEVQDCNLHPCPIDGVWTSWGTWDTCSVTCGGGIQSRSRSCTDPAPQHGGQDCTGASDEVQDCNTHDCPIDGGFTDWSVWSTCSATCGSGTKSRTRTCTNPAPQHGGQDCVGDTSEDTACNTNACSVDGSWGDWSQWGTCTKSCDGGQRSRTRVCDNPAPSSGGQDCIGTSSMFEDCNTTACPTVAPGSYVQVQKSSFFLLPVVSSFHNKIINCPYVNKTLTLLYQFSVTWPFASAKKIQFAENWCKRFLRFISSLGDLKVE